MSKSPTDNVNQLGFSRKYVHIMVAISFQFTIIMPSVCCLLKKAKKMADFPYFFISLSCHIVVIGFVGRHTGKRLALFRSIGEIATLIKLQLALNGIDESALLLVELYTSCK